MGELDKLNVSQLLDSYTELLQSDRTHRKDYNCFVDMISREEMVENMNADETNEDAESNVGDGIKEEKSFSEREDLFEEDSLF